ncbi:DUF1579 domain-containing protein [Xanthomarina spongicola]|uniref:Uncharacterized protein DUF1579 n=1 Tax=Xanthomarina spongicola TaxID=570520 RepID=A0A316DH13_9FLAO|nr:DUF1579 domain-containing protein [Xanthomarina spongicola]PWK17424.1 uncharacterized protein DUF1579 [Xanthomarina spongicola]
MKKIIITSICLLLGLSSYSQTPEEMKAWQDNMTPGEHHEWLASMNGEWDATVTMWMDPSQPPNISKATTVNEMIMGGLYQRSSHTGNMMGMPFTGEAITGYDKAQNKFLAIWIDNFGSSIMFLEGQYNPETNVLTLEGNMIDPATGNNLQIREVFTKTSEDSHNFVMYMILDGKEIKNMEINYNRKK